MTTSEVFPSHMAQVRTSLEIALAQRRSPPEKGCSVIWYMFAHNHLSFWSNQVTWWPTNLAGIFPTCYRHQSTCQFKITCKITTSSVVHMAKWFNEPTNNRRLFFSHLQCPYFGKPRLTFTLGPPPAMLGHVHVCSAFTSRVEDFVHDLRALWLPVVQSISLIGLASWCLEDWWNYDLAIHQFCLKFLGWSDHWNIKIASMLWRMLRW